MFKLKTSLSFLLLILLLWSLPGLAITAEEIIEQRDSNEYYTRARVEAEMVLTERDIKKTMISLTDGENALVEFTNPRDRGTKYLKKGDELFMFFPDAEDIVQLSGHMLEQGFEGSDFSYRDLMESDKLIELYNFEIIEEEKEYEGRDCYLIEGVKEEGAEVSYYRRLLWVDKERYIGLREELYAESGRLLKVARVTEVEEIEGRWFPVETEMENKLRQDSKTIFRIEDIEFNPEIAEGTFTIENLR